MKKNSIIIIVITALVVLVLLAKSSDSNRTLNEDPVRIGAILPMTGPAGFYGEEMTHAINLALEDINKDTNVVEVFIEDSESQPAKGVSAMTKLESTTRPDIYFSVLSSVGMSVAPLAEQYEVPLLALTAYAPQLTKQNEYTYRFFPLAEDEAVLIAQTMRELGLKSVGVLHLNDDYGNATAKAVQQDLEPDGIKVYTESFLLADSDYRQQIFNLQANGVEALYVIGFDGHVLKAIPQVRDSGFTGELFGSVSVPQPTNIEQFGERAEGIYSVYPRLTESNSKLTRSFNERYFAKHGRQPGVYAANAYDAIWLVYEELLGEGEVTRESVLENLQELQGHNGVFGDLVINGKEIAFPLYPIQIKDGVIEYLE